MVMDVGQTVTVMGRATGAIATMESRMALAKKRYGGRTIIAAHPKASPKASSMVVIAGIAIMITADMIMITTVIMMITTMIGGTIIIGIGDYNLL